MSVKLLGTHLSRLVVSAVPKWTASPHNRVPFVQCIAVAGVRDLPKPPTFDHVEYPPERRKLRFVEKVPHPVPGQRIQKSMKRLIDMRGPELINNKLMHKQFGIQAITGGQLKYGHFEMMRMTINRKLEEKKMFAIWRIDPPWKPITKKGQGHRMGGGKGSIDHYTTPIKAGRIIIEIGGHVEYNEVLPLLSIVAKKLPFKAKPVSQEILEQDEADQKHLEENNLNIFTYEHCLRNNMLGARKWSSPYDYKWFGKHR